MAPQLLQVKVDPVLKADLQEIANYKGIPMTSFIKMTLTAVVRKEKKEMFTANGLTEAEELEILRREKEAISEYRTGKSKAKSGRQILRELNA